MKNLIVISLLILSGCQLSAAPGGSLMVDSTGKIYAPPGAVSNFAGANAFLSNGSTGVTLTGTFSGNIGGITNLTSTNVVGTLTNNISGNASNATNFSGSLSGNVTGTQGATVVAIAPASAITGTVNITNLTAALQTLSSNNGGNLTNVASIGVTTNGFTNSTSAISISGSSSVTINSSTGTTITGGGLSVTGVGITGAGNGITSLNAANLSSGTIPTAVLPASLATLSSNNGVNLTNFGWTTNGNSGNSSGAYLGTSDSQPLVVKVNGNQMLYISGNTILGGTQNTLAVCQDGIVGNGLLNALANSDYAAILGGKTNAASFASYAAIGGGYSNVVSSASYGTIPGGYGNTVNANYGFAVGKLSTVNNVGSFVWSDSTGGAQDTAANQFVVQATGGVVISNSSLYLTNTTNAFNGNGGGLTNTFSPGGGLDLTLNGTGITNTGTRFGVVHITSASVTYNLFNATGTQVGTNTSIAGENVTLAPGGKLTAASGLTGYMYYP